MKTIPYVLVVILFSGTVFSDTAVSEVSSQDEGKVLCRMLASSLSDPWKFDTVIAAESNHFDNRMIGFIQGQAKKLTTQAEEHEAVCEPYKHKSMGYDLCMGNNPARELATWLDSVLQTAKGSRWEQTEFGNGQLKIWNSCNNPAFCEQLRSAAALGVRRECPLWFTS